MHKLDYRDPVQHTVIGLMHNWIEGILQHQTRVKYGIGIVANPRAKDADNKDGGSTTPPATPTGHELDVNIDMLDDELAEPRSGKSNFLRYPITWQTSPF